MAKTNENEDPHAPIMSHPKPRPLRHKAASSQEITDEHSLAAGGDEDAARLLLSLQNLEYDPPQVIHGHLGAGNFPALGEELDISEDDPGLGLTDGEPERDELNSDNEDLDNDG